MSFKEPPKRVKSLFQGIGYVVPHDMKVTEFRKLYAKWEGKLADSGFADIEIRTLNHTGKFIPFFNDKSSSTTMLNVYDEYRAIYYQLATEFLHKFDFQKAFGKEAFTYKTLWRMHSEGIPYRSVAKAFSGKLDKRSNKYRAVDIRIQRKCSYFWAFTHTHLVLNYFWSWASKQGYVDPRTEVQKFVKLSK